MGEVHAQGHYFIFHGRESNWQPSDYYPDSLTAQPPDNYNKEHWEALGYLESGTLCVGVSLPLRACQVHQVQLGGSDVEHLVGSLLGL